MLKACAGYELKKLLVFFVAAATVVIVVVCRALSFLIVDDS